MIQGALIVLADPRFVERQVGEIFCARPAAFLRDRCLRRWRAVRRCGCTAI